MNGYSVGVDLVASFMGFCAPRDRRRAPHSEARTMARSLTKSNAHFRKANSKLPLGVSSNFRYWGEDKTIYARSGKGARLTDIDGNEYIDYRLAYGPCILGYADPRVDE